MHLQGDVVTEAGAFGGFLFEMVKTTGVLPRSQEVLTAARAAGSPVACTRVTFTEGHPELIVNNMLFSVVDQQKCCVERTPGTTVVPEMAPVDGDLDVPHHRVSGACDSGLVERLRERGVDTVLIFGVATNLSDKGTVRHLSDQGFRVIVLADCCTAADQTTHDASLGSLGLLVAEVGGAASAIEALQAGVAA